MIPQAVAAGRRDQLQAFEEQKAIILVLAGAKRIRSKWLQDCTTGGTEVKSRPATTEVAYGNRDDCFAGTLPAEGFTLGGQLGDVNRKETRVLRR